MMNIDLEFKRIIPELTTEELSQLEESILSDGCRDSLMVWAETDILLDGHNRLEICNRNGIDYKITAISLPDRDSAILWIIGNQMGRRNLQAIDKVPLTERAREIIERRARERVRAAQNNNSGRAAAANLPEQEKGDTRDKLAEQIGVSGKTYDALAKVTKQGAPELVDAVRKNKVGAATAAIIAELPKEQQKIIAGKTEKEIVAHAKKIKNHRAIGTGENEWYTPDEYIAAAVATFGGAIDLDPASSEFAQDFIKAKTFYTADDDGLSKQWKGRVWMNPPYAQPEIRLFIEKLVSEHIHGGVNEAIALTHNYSDTSWFHHIAMASSAICLTRGRIAFINANGEKAAPTQGQAFFYLGNRPESFMEHFKQFGLILKLA